MAAIIHAANDRNQPVGSPPLSGGSSSAPLQLCRDFMRGFCHRARCRFHHPTTTCEPARRRVVAPRSHSRSVRPRGTLRSNTCPKYLRGQRCRYGASCKFLHPESPLVLPDELLTEIVNCLGATDLCQLALVCKRLGQVCMQNISRWHALFSDKWGVPKQLEWRAATLAGGWQQLYKAKTVMDREASPWKKPSAFEVDALGLLITDTAFPPEAARVHAGAAHDASTRSAARPLTVVFLLDGSGSLSEIDFDVMRSFVKRTVEIIMQRCPEGKVGIVQFTTEVRVEVDPSSVELAEVPAQVDRMQRMSGGTNLEAPIHRAEQLMREQKEEEQGAHVLVLLSDGIVDPNHARDAAREAQNLSKHLAHVSLFALGVGRDVDVNSMKRIIGEEQLPNGNNRNDESASSAVRGMSTASFSNVASPATPPSGNLALDWLQQTARTSHYLGLSTLGHRATTWM
mmetsp:Transcript_36846/g.69322  ORF Transcript_36846/g.69322 Transcript_36846/m.69322 type:complete len:456 (-) Transcript_36846:566-1933(-)